MEFLIKNLLDWAMITGVTLLSGFILGWAGKKIREYIIKVVDKVDKEIAKIENDDLEIACRHVVRYIAQTMPKADSNIKLQAAILRVNQIVPNIIMSNDKIETFIESAYLEFKRELSRI
jgi:hypothetical protein